MSNSFNLAFTSLTKIVQLTDPTEHVSNNVVKLFCQIKIKRRMTYNITLVLFFTLLSNSGTHLNCVFLYKYKLSTSCLTVMRLFIEFIGKGFFQWICLFSKRPVILSEKNTHILIMKFHQTEFCNQFFFFEIQLVYF